MRDLKYIHFFEELLESPCNALVRQARLEGRFAVGYPGSGIPEALLNCGNLFSVRLRDYGAYTDPSFPDFTVPETLPGPDAAEDHLISPLKECFGTDFSDGSVRRAVGEYNELCDILASVDELRRGPDPRITPREAAVLTLVSCACPQYLLVPYLRETLAELRERVTDGEGFWKARVAVAGGPVKTYDLAGALETCRCYAAADLSLGPGRKRVELSGGKSALGQLIAKISPDGDLSCPEADSLRDIAEKSGAGGILLVHTSLSLESYQDMLDTAGALEEEYDVPASVVRIRPDADMYGQLTKKIGSFARILEMYAMRDEINNQI